MTPTWTGVFCWLLALGGSLQSVYNNTPDWISEDGLRGTGGALVDLNRDGWMDFVVANGNDMARQAVAVYYNRGDGTFGASPDWLSDDKAFNGHLDVADVNGDGWPDVAVAVLGDGSTIDNAAKVYLNNEGVLSALPDWQSTEIANAFSCAFGDVNNDGWPDLAVGTGWSYSPQHFFANYVYLNDNGTLADSASWLSEDTYHYLGVLWVDADDDGWLDLVGIGSLSGTRIYRNLGGTLETAGSWQTADSAGQDAIMATAGDVNGDGRRDLFVTDNTQLDGSGLFRMYPGLADGFFQTTYDWSYFGWYGSAVALADVDGDGRLDLATGGWWDDARLFLNDGAGFGDAPDWKSDASTATGSAACSISDSSRFKRSSPSTWTASTRTCPTRTVASTAGSPSESPRRIIWRCSTRPRRVSTWRSRTGTPGWATTSTTTDSVASPTWTATATPTWTMS